LSSFFFLMSNVFFLPIPWFWLFFPSKFSNHQTRKHPQPWSGLFIVWWMLEFSSQIWSSRCQRYMHALTPLLVFCHFSLNVNMRTWSWLISSWSMIFYYVKWSLFLNNPEFSLCFLQMVCLCLFFIIDKKKKKITNYSSQHIHSLPRLPDFCPSHCLVSPV
jgi:hypothetical protein